MKKKAGLLHGRVPLDGCSALCTSLAGPVPASQTPSSQDWLPAYSPQAPASDCPSKRRWGTHPSATLPRNMMSLPDSSSTYHLSLPWSKDCYHLLRVLSTRWGVTLGPYFRHVRLLVHQTLDVSAADSRLSLQAWRWASIGLVGMHTSLSSFLPSPWNETKIAFWEMWVFLDNCVSTSIAEKLSSKLQRIWEYCFFAEQNYSA